MKINFFINTLDGGGAEKVLVDLANQLPQDKYDITITTLLHGVHEDKLARHVHHHCIIGTRNRFVSYVLERIYCRIIPHKLFARLFLQGEYDLMVSYLEGFNTHIVAAYNGKAKRAAFVHCNTGVDTAWTQTYRSLEECLFQYKSFDKVCFISQDALDGFERVVGHLSNSSVVHNVIDLRAVIEKSKVRLQLSPHNDDTTIIKLVSVGRLTKVKGYERLLNVIARLRDEKLICQLIICGDGDARKELENMARRKKISNVYFLGFQSNPYPYMRKADFYVCSSYSEGYSTSVVESIALGIPVLTTDCSGMREILCDGEYGDIVENSEEGIYYGLKHIVTDSEHRYSLRSKAEIRSKELLAMNPLKEYTELFDNI